MVEPEETLDPPYLAPSETPAPTEAPPQPDSAEQEQEALDAFDANAWSAWVTALPSGVSNNKNAYNIQSRTEYRYRDKQFTTSQSSSLSGWTQSGYTWSGWSAWQDAAISGSATREVRTQQVPNGVVLYRYSHYHNPNNAAYVSPNPYYSGQSADYTGWMTSALPHAGSSSVGGAKYETTWKVTGCAQPYLWYNQQTQNQQKTQYSYRDKTFSYWRWGNWSAWSTTKATASANRGVETRTTYRYQAKAAPTAAPTAKPTAKPSTWPATGVEGYVTRMYSVVLGRTPDPNGHAYWVSALKNGSKNGAEVAAGFFFSDEYKKKNKSNSAYIDDLYKTILDRSADSGGRTNWLNTLNKGVSREYLLRGFVESPEFTNICSGFGITRGSLALSQARDRNIQVTAFVNRLYSLCLGRNGEENGLNDWCNRLLSGSSSGAASAAGFVFSNECKNKRLSNTAFVTMLYKAMMDRSPDNAGLNDWVGQLNRGASREYVFNGFVYSNEFRKICANYGITLGVSPVNGSGPQPTAADRQTHRQPHCQTHCQTHAGADGGSAY